ncbi:hypothetical protein, partial [Altererythrobacter sp. MTPC7]
QLPIGIFAIVSVFSKIYYIPRNINCLFITPSRHWYAAISGGFPPTASPLLPRSCCTCVGKQISSAWATGAQEQLRKE